MTDELTDLTKVRDIILVDMRDSLKRALEQQKQAIIDTERQIAEYQAELDHRALEAFWIAHPGLRLNAGDKLAHEFSNLPAYMPLYVESILMESVQVIAATRKDDWIAVGGGEYPFLSLRLPLVFARQMREAYLAQHEGETP